jgi:methylmalonyl-CoA/ethylmalonyl-CoA epimerase
MTSPARPDPSPAGPLGPVTQVLVPVTDLERATAFYRDVLGLPHLFSIAGGAFLGGGGVRIYLALADASTPPGRSILYHAVRDIDATVRDLAARGARVRTRPHVIDRGPGRELRLAFVDDTEGNAIGLLEEVALATPAEEPEA